MARYETTIKRRILVSCKCEKCGRKYRYETIIQSKGRGYSQEGCRNDAVKNINKKLDALQSVSSSDYKGLRHIESKKCPQCNKMQSWMQLYHRRRYTTWLIMVAWVVTVMIIGLVPAINTSMVNIVVTILVAVAALIMGMGVVQMMYSGESKDRVNLPQLTFPSHNTSDAK